MLRLGSQHLVLDKSNLRTLHRYGPEHSYYTSFKKLWVEYAIVL
jgi:hypothetical protein